MYLIKSNGDNDWFFKSFQLFLRGMKGSKEELVRGIFW